MAVPADGKKKKKLTAFPLSGRMRGIIRTGLFLQPRFVYVIHVERNS